MNGIKDRWEEEREIMNNEMEEVKRIIVNVKIENE